MLDKTYAARRRKNNFKPDKVRFWSQWLTHRNIALHTRLKPCKL